MDKITAQQNEHEAEGGVLMTIKKLVAVSEVMAYAEARGMSVEDFVTEAIIAAMDQRKAIPIDIEVYNQLEARASGRGLKIEQLFARASFQEFVLDGLQRGAF